MNTQTSPDALLSMDRQPETATEQTTATETKDTKETKPGDGAETATAGNETTDVADDAAAKDGAETVEAENEGDKPADEGAPETYQLEAPEGITVDLESDEAKAFEAFCRAKNLTQAEAQQAFEMLTKPIAEINAQITKAQKEASDAWDKETTVDWPAAVMSDELIGGTKEEVDQKLGVAMLALEKYGDAELDALMKRFRLGSNPAILRFMHRAGLPLQEETSIHRGGGRAEERKSDAEVFFGDQAQG